MKNKYKVCNVFILKMLILCCFILFSGCKSYAQPGAPYVIDGRIDMEDEKSSVCSVELNFLNRSEKTVCEFTVIFYLFDSEGELYSLGKNNIILSININICGYESYECSVSLDNYFTSIHDDVYTMDYLYVSQIKYSDGTLWEDPFGLKAF